MDKKGLRWGHLNENARLMSLGRRTHFISRRQLAVTFASVVFVTSLPSAINKAKKDENHHQHKFVLILPRP
jgi:hypothetical protein